MQYLTIHQMSYFAKELSPVSNMRVLTKLAVCCNLGKIPPSLSANAARTSTRPARAQTGLQT